MKHLRILLLVPRGQEPPAERAELGDDLLAPAAVHFDLAEALRALGHEVVVLGASNELGPIGAAIEGGRTHIVFNQLLDFLGIPLYDAYVVSYLELLRVKYTGCNPRALLLASDKALAKKILSYHRLPTPGFFAVPRGRAPRVPRRLGYPLFVKTRSEHGSVGIAQASVVRSDEDLRERVAFVHESLGADAMVEQYVGGREFTIGVLGNRRLQTLPIFEMRFRHLAEGASPIATSRVKWDRKYQQRVGFETGPAEDLAPEIVERIVRLAKRVYRVLGMSGYGRIDMRMDERGEVFVLEANPNPDIALGEDLAASAALAGLDYGALLSRVLGLGLRYRPSWTDV